MTRGERTLQLALLGAFTALFCIKIWVPIRDSDFVTLPAAIRYALLFGAPQLLWVVVVAVTTNARHFDRALVVLGFIVAIYALAGFFPGMKPANLGGYAHFEVPLALIAELVVALLFLFVGRGRSRTSSGT